MPTIQQINTNTAVDSRPSTADLRENAIRASLSALTVAANRHDHVAVANLSAALRELWGS